MGGKNRLPMADLRAILESLGFTHVQTYVQSGNAIIESATVPDNVAIAAAILDSLQIKTIVVMRSHVELQELLRANPFANEAASSLHFGFMSQRADAEIDDTNEVDRFTPDQFAVRGSDVYMVFPNGMGHSKLMPWLDRRFRQEMTIRNFNTVMKLIAMSAEGDQ